MKTLLIYLTLLIPLAAIAQREGVSTYTYHAKSALKITESNGRVNHIEIVPGENLILVCEFKAFDNPNIADDEYKEKVYIEVKKDGRKFSTTTDQSVAYFMKGCYCTDRGYHKALPDGTISGKKNIIGDYRVKYTLRFKTNQETESIYNLEKTTTASFRKYKPAK
ncbi:MAG: hypothetical protein WC150_06295 [Bacteroidia bacterium]